MELDERKVKILNAIIQNYLETGEPVGSRTISKALDLNLSSATIRNEMADLEELEYIMQPHTSAGRIPSDKGYRFYVDHMMEERIKQLESRELEVSNMQELLSEKVDRVEELLQNVAKVLANDTNYATMVATPRGRGRKLKFVQISQLEPNKLLAVIVMDGNLVRNKFITLSENIDQEILLKLNLLVNTTLNGLTMEEMNLGLITRMQGQAGEYADIVQEVLEAVAETMAGADGMQIYTSGATNIFKYPELSDSSKASELICTFEEKEQLKNLIHDIEEDDQ
ncbi:MAG: heat-inducible transcriptional repressor HrcA, partial [Lachnospiraceae bacterium]